MKAGGLNLKYSLGGWGHLAPRLKKALENRWVEMHLHFPICHDQLKEKKLTNRFNSLGAREGGNKCLKNRSKN